jgi:hypothetical protein
MLRTHIGLSRVQEIYIFLFFQLLEGIPERIPGRTQAGGERWRELGRQKPKKPFLSFMLFLSFF